MSQPLLEVNDLAVEYRTGIRRPPVRAVDGVSFTINAHETTGLVGESGSGKTTIGRAVLGLAPISRGVVRFAGREITHATQSERRQLSSEMQAVFQDPYTALNPTRTIFQSLTEVLRVHGQNDEEVVWNTLERVGLDRSVANRYPVGFSGGQRQRISIARALMTHPGLVICDEPTSALDLSVQAHILNLLSGLQAEFGLSYLFISHDLAVVRHVAEQMIVLYQGRVMEQGRAAQIYDAPLHPYSQILVAAAPVPDPDEQRLRREKRRRVRGDASVDAAVSSVGGDSCPFSSRCPHVIEICRATRPLLEPSSHGTLVACHRWRELAA